jgi:hypothetical protein
MKALNSVATLFVALTLMVVILVAQHDYQQSWSAQAVAQQVTVSDAASSIPMRLAQANQ